VSDPRKQYAPGTVLDPEEIGLDVNEAAPPVAAPPAEPAIHGESQAGAALRGAESGALFGFNQKAAAGIDTLVSHHPWLADFAAKISGDESLRDPSMTYEQRLEKYKQAAAESAAKYPKTTFASEVGGAVLPGAGRLAGIAGKGVEAAAERFGGQAAGRIAKILAPAGEGAAIGVTTAEGEDTDHARGAGLGAALGMAPGLLGAVARPLGRLLRKVPWLGSAPERIKPVQAAANAQGLGIADTKAEAERLLREATKDPEARRAVFGQEPSTEGATRLAQHVVDLRNGLTATILSLPAKAAGALKEHLAQIGEAIDAGDMKAVRQAAAEATKESARLGLSPDEEKNIADRIRRLDVATRLAHGINESVPHGGTVSPVHPRQAALLSGNPVPALSEAAGGVNPHQNIMAAGMGMAKKPVRALGRKAAEFMVDTEAGNTAGIQEKANELLHRNLSPSRALLQAIQSKHGLNAGENENEPIHTADELAKQFRAMGMSDHQIARIIEHEYNAPMAKRLRAEGKGAEVKKIEGAP